MVVWRARAMSPASARFRDRRESRARAWRISSRMMRWISEYPFERRVRGRRAASRSAVRRGSPRASRRPNGNRPALVISACSATVPERRSSVRAG